MGPESPGLTVGGYCALCNLRHANVAFLQWYLCANCERVVRSYSVGSVAVGAVKNWWATKVQPHESTLELVETDPIFLAPYDQESRGAEAALPDFTVRNKANGADEFPIELKTGRSSIKEMRAFQLDTSDCDEIVGFTQRLGLPAYVIHAQVREAFDPPTSYFECIGLWWSDIFSMAQRFQRLVKRRIDHGKTAAFFDREAFRDIQTLVDHVKQRDYRAQQDKLREVGIPVLYHE